MRDEPAPPSVILRAPAAGQVAFGPTLLRAQVSPPAGARVSRVQFLVDGATLGTLYTPPFEARWEAGEDLASHRFEVRAFFSDGTRATDRITTRGLRTVQREVVEGTPIEHVELLISVTDRRGEPVRGLTQALFRVQDGEEAVEITTFRALNERRDIPLSVAVLVDRSGSMRMAMKDWRQASHELIDSLRPVDQVRVAAFAEEMTILQDFTRDKLSLASSIGLLGGAGGATHLFRAVHETVRDLRDLPGRKALFILSDGLDSEFTSYSSPKTIHWYPILVETARMASRAGITIVVILPRPVNSRDYLAIQDLAMQTGGWYMYPSDDLGSLFRRLGERLLSSYLLAYDVQRPGDVERKRSVQVTLVGEEENGRTVRSALGAWAGIDMMEALRSDLEEGSSAQRARALGEIGRLDRGEGQALALESLKDRSPVVRIAALALLGEFRDPESLEPILDRLHDSMGVVREAARRAAARFGEAAILPLERKAGGGGGARGPALRALGAIGDPSVAPILYESLSSRRCDVRAAAAEGLGSLLLRNGGAIPAVSIPEGSPAPRSRLAGSLEEGCSEERDAAALALGRLGEAEPFRRLAAMAASADPDRRPGEALLALFPLADGGGAAARESARGAVAGTVTWLLTEPGREWLAGLRPGEGARLLAGLEAYGTDASVLSVLRPLAGAY